MQGNVRVGIHGAAGRMGQRLVALVRQDRQLQLVAAWEHPRHPQLGQDAGAVAGDQAVGVPLTTLADQALDVVIDFSSAQAVDDVVRACASRRWPLVLATTGLNDGQETQVRRLAEIAPVVWAPNMSLAVNLTMKLTEQAAAALHAVGAVVDVEILERHHRFKEDAPSGTALKFGERIAGIMGQTQARHGREGIIGRRPGNEIGYHAIRVADDPGQHTIIFAMMGETIELTVRALTRDSYASGALAAAKFVAAKAPGLYDMYDVLGLAPTPPSGPPPGTA